MPRKGLTIDYTALNAKEAAIQNKNKILEKNVRKLENLHSRIMQMKYLTRQTVPLNHIENSLSPHFRRVFFANPSHAYLLAHLNQLNLAFLNISDTVCSYRMSLGGALEKLVESYNSIYLQQFEIFYKHKLDKEEQLEKKICEHEGKI